MNYTEALKYLNSLQSTKIELGLSRIEKICSFLGHPENKFKSIIVAGTNGKGSTCAFLESILRSQGLKVGLYISPHLIDVRERIEIDRVMISEEDFARMTEVITTSGMELTYFEFLTAVAFQYFAEQKVDIAVLEVGLGGRFDATNVVTPIVSVITRLGMDHMGYLGDTIEKIAFEKSGIIKKSVPVVTIDQELSAMEVIRKTAEEQGSMLHLVSPFHVKFKLGLDGPHQYENAALAIRSAEIAQDSLNAEIALDDNLLQNALLNAKWPGRMEIVSKDPLVILDGAHNPNGAKALAKYIRIKFFDRHKILLLGIMHDKDVDGILQPLAEVADEIILTRPSIPRAADPKTIKLENSKVVEPLPLAISETIASMKKEDVLIIAGSLYTVGEAKAYFSR